MSTRTCDITVIGGGFCGAMTVVQLLRHAAEPLRIRLVERHGHQLARGVAYGTNEPCHLLNVPAGRMSAIPEDPNHFLNWARGKEAELLRSPWIPEVSSTAYLPRTVYGDYVEHLFHDTIKHAGKHVVEIIVDEVARIEPVASGMKIRTRGNADWLSRTCVMAVGNAQPSSPGPWARSLEGHTGYHARPWDNAVLPELTQTDSCLLVGSGLTMMDVVMSLYQRSYKGTIHVIARRGLTPLAQQVGQIPQQLPQLADRLADAPGIRHLLRELRQEARNGSAEGRPWQLIVDAIRPATASIWQRLSVPEQRQFLRHVRPYWDHHRHRVAPLIRDTFDRMVESGHVVIHRGRIVDAAREANNGISTLSLRTRDGDIAHVAAEHVVNCIGPGALERESTALVQSLVSGCGATMDALGIGWAVDSQLRVVGARTEGIYALGPPTKGNFWECTAVPECRKEAERIADMLTAEH